MIQVLNYIHDQGYTYIIDSSKTKVGLSNYYHLGFNDINIRFIIRNPIKRCISVIKHRKLLGKKQTIFDFLKLYLITKLKLFNDKFYFKDKKCEIIKHKKWIINDKFNNRKHIYQSNDNKFSNGYPKQNKNKINKRGYYNNN